MHPDYVPEEPICLNGPHCRHPLCPEHSHQDEWFNNEMAFPVMGERVVVRLRDGSELVGAILQGDMDWWWRDKFFDHSEVTHWRWL